MFQFSTKAETLEHLESTLKTAEVLPQIRFTVQAWNKAKPFILKQLHEKAWFSFPVIVRSSSRIEDGFKESLAGKFISVPNVLGECQISQAINRVISSYETKLENDIVFIQPMLQNVVLSGVVFSMDPSTGGPYIVINYDDVSGMTDSITSGCTNGHKVFYYYKKSPIEAPSPLNRIIQMVREIESNFPQTKAIDIEFALTTDDRLFCLQARPLLIPENMETNEIVQPALKEIYRKLKDHSRPHPYLHGAKSIFGIMPDWNPAEIIGVKPKLLALSLYSEIITDNIWAYQRDNYGYKNLRSFPLLIRLGGLPYIDVRVSFNSFIPAGVSAELSEKLADYYLGRLIDSPSYHDKVEFEIIYSCYTPDLPERITTLKNFNFSTTEREVLTEHLRTLTNRIINGKSGLWCNDLEKIRTLESRCSSIMSSELDSISKVYWLLEDCKRYGTLPFAGLARAAFIAVQFLRSLVAVKIITQGEHDVFLQTLNTVSSQMSEDFTSLTRELFLKRYGHLRPGTYDILSPRYDEKPERYFDWSNSKITKKKEKQAFSLSLEQIRQTEKILKEHKLDHDVLGIFDFIKAAIEGREYAKFIFTRNLSEALSIFNEIGKSVGLTTEECAFADISCIKTLYSSSLPVEETLRCSVLQGKQQYALTKLLNLPPLITSPDDIWSFHLPLFHPNYITLKKAIGKVVHIKSEKPEQSMLEESILFIPSADPGYDWIFSHGIKGFITMYGGVNSHMAIRAAELGIPAVIGAGETLYTEWSDANLVELDCPNRQVRRIR